MAIELILAIGLVFANAFFVAAEFTIARLRPTQAEEFARQGRPGARSTLHAGGRGRSCGRARRSTT